MAVGGQVLGLEYWAVGEGGRGVSSISVTV